MTESLEEEREGGRKGREGKSRTGRGGQEEEGGRSDEIMYF